MSKFVHGYVRYRTYPLFIYIYIIDNLILFFWHAHWIKNCTRFNVIQMDREISSEERNKDTWKKLIKAILLVVVLGILILLFRKVLGKNIDHNDLLIVNVEKGNILNKLSASGVIVPAFERALNAPVTTEIKEIIKQTGQHVKSQDLIMKLNQEFTQLEYDKLHDELELRKNNINKLELQFDKEVKDLGHQADIKGIQIEELEAQLSNKKTLFKIGGVTEDEVKGLELQLKIAKIEKEMLENNHLFKQKVNKTERKGLGLEYTIQEKRLIELRKKLQNTDVRAPIGGVITWINENIGRTVTAGEPLVRIANLDKYKVEATTSERYAQSLLLGMEVEVRIGKTNLKGFVDRILPEVIDNTVKFIVRLEDPSHELLRSNMRTDVFLITDEKHDVLKLKNGKAIKGAKKQFVFVVKDGKAHKQQITKGISNGEYVEVVDGLNIGDQVIISDISNFDYLDEFSVNK